MPAPYINVAVVVDADAAFHVRAHGGLDDTRIASVNLGALTLQGDPEAMLTFLDNARRQLANAVYNQWPPPAREPIDVVEFRRLLDSKFGSAGR